MNPNTLKLIRQTHLYVGMFISPAVLFFAFTGAVQTFGLHEKSAGSSYTPPAWVLPLAQLHKKQTTEIRKDKPVQASGSKAPGASPAVAPVAAPKVVTLSSLPLQQHLPLKLFFLLVSIGLATSTFTGIVMAYKYNRSKVVVTLLLVLGVVVPVVLMRF